jgi:hypothetical protein
MSKQAKLNSSHPKLALIQKKAMEWLIKQIKNLSQGLD